MHLEVALGGGGRDDDIYGGRDVIVQREHIPASVLRGWFVHVDIQSFQHLHV